MLSVVLAASSSLALWTAFARPKSSTFSVPSSVTMTLAGFRSRWMMDAACAFERAAAS